MKAAFVESEIFTEWVTEYLSDDIYAALQQDLMNNPEKGDVIPGCGGLRKVRVADPRRGKGRRGGARVIYLYVPDVKKFFMIDGFGKGEQADLSIAEKKILAKFVNELKREARAVYNRQIRSRE